MTEINNSNINSTEVNVSGSENNANANNTEFGVEGVIAMENQVTATKSVVVHENKKSSMPQMNIDTFASQIFWLAVTFFVLYIIMDRKAIPTIRDVLQNRQTRVSEDLRKAEKLKEEAESAEADFTSVIIKARSKASSLLSKVRDDATIEADKRNNKLDETFARQNKESEHRIEVIKKEAVSEMEPVTIELAQEMVKKLINVKIDKSKVEKAVSAVAGK